MSTSSTKTKKYREVKQLNLPEIEKQVSAFWEDDETFKKSISSRADGKPFVFYEGPPSANGLPGIHHVMGRAIKDLFCRYKTMQGYLVNRKGGWDTHGLPVELGVEKSLGITKEDIGKSISIDEYNQACRKEVMKYKDAWDEITRKMGYWVDLDDPYITFDNKYIETLWSLLKQLYDKDFLYKGYTIQPYSPAAGTGLSSHELNLPGCYKNVKDTSIVAQFEAKNEGVGANLFQGDEKVYLLAWTTTPWTLPSNCALAVGAKIEYIKVKSFNRYTGEPISVVLAKELLGKHFPESKKSFQVKSESELKYQGDKEPIPFLVTGDSWTGADLEGVRYHQLMPYVQPDPEKGEAFRVIIGDFVSTEDGTGIVHTASVFGADDFRVCQANNIPSILVEDENGNETPLVNKKGQFVKEVTDYAGRYVKEEYYSDEERKAKDFLPTDVLIAIQLKKENKAFNIEKYEHNYPHCWRTDKPVLYYPLDSWFIRTTAVKDKFVEHNNTINWKPESTGTGRFGQWLENLVDWNLSRSRYWGTPLPIWRSEDGTEEKCIGSIEDLKIEVEKSISAGFMKAQLQDNFDLHRPYVDDIILVSDSGKQMYREADLIDVWFDSGAMPYAQWHFPFENKDIFEKNFPADFIAEGVDQTRGWFYTLHVIAVMLFDSVAFKNVVSNGLVLDKKGNKMSKRLGNAVDPFETIDKYGADATRWYMISNSQPWDNLKFDENGIAEVQRKFFGTLFNTYSFFALYANIDGFTYEEEEVPFDQRPEIDRWVLSLLNTLVQDVNGFYDDYEPTKAARAIQDFTDTHLSNWYVRLSRRRFWKGEYSEDKIAAYQTLYQCISTLTKLMAPVAPFFADFLFGNLEEVAGKSGVTSVHLASFPEVKKAFIDKGLEERMQYAQYFSSMVLSLRKKENLKVRQPLAKILIPVLNPKFKEQVQLVENLIKSEVNVKEVEYVEDTSGIIVKKIKPDFRTLGKKLGPKMKQAGAIINAFSQEQIAEIERNGNYSLNLDGEKVEILREEVEITSEDIPGWLVTNMDELTVALDINLTDELVDEGNARELVNKIQRMRKDKGFEVTDRIRFVIQPTAKIKAAINRYNDYICSEILAETVEFDDSLNNGETTDVNGETVSIFIERKN